MIQDVQFLNCPTDVLEAIKRECKIIDDNSNNPVVSNSLKTIDNLIHGVLMSNEYGYYGKEK